MANFKITTQEEKDECLMWISDLYKDVHGYRPRNWDFNAMSFDMGDDTELDPYAIDYFTSRRGISYSKAGEAVEEELTQIVNDNPAAFGLAA